MDRGQAPPLGSLWQDSLAIALAASSKPVDSAAGAGGGDTAARGGCAGAGSSRRLRPLSVVYLYSEEVADEGEPLPLSCLRDAACGEGLAAGPAELSAVPFGTVALGDTATLDCFYNAGESHLGGQAGKERAQAPG